MTVSGSSSYDVGWTHARSIVDIDLIWDDHGNEPRPRVPHFMVAAFQHTTSPANSSSPQLTDPTQEWLFWSAVELPLEVVLTQFEPVISRYRGSLHADTSVQRTITEFGPNFDLVVGWVESAFDVTPADVQFSYNFRNLVLETTLVP
jgi:hypothetical protein